MPLRALLLAAIILAIPAASLARDGKGEPQQAAPAPTREAFEVAVKARMGEILRDPESAVYVAKGELRRVSIDAGFSLPLMTGWAGCYMVNAKNGYGGYTGAQRYLFILGDNGQISYIDSDGPTPGMLAALDRECPAGR